VLQSLKPDPGNAQWHSAKQVRQIASSIAAFGFNAPVLVDEDLKVIAGHARLAAAKRLGLTHAPVVQFNHLATRPSERLSPSATITWPQARVGTSGGSRHVRPVPAPDAASPS
jgi:hypothetical protein